MAHHSMELRHLAQVDRHLIEAAERITQQEAMFATLDRDGHDTTEAIRLLEALRGVREQGIIHRRLILQALNEPEEGSAAG